MTRIVALLGTLLVGALQAQDPPPAYPRDGAIKMFENEDLVVWNITWLKQPYPIHRHRFDLVGVYYTDGDRIIVSTEGERRPVHTDAWSTVFQRSGVTHAEEGASDNPLHAVFVEIKRKGMFGSAGGVGEPFPVGDPTQRLDNDRVAIWDYAADSPPPHELHRHVHDAVIVSFNGSREPTARYVTAGTADDGDAVPGATRTFVFEIK